ncbi:MAG: methyltransferase domain-containing protein [Candidatus Omnitrophota bacterium]|nr:methyltransferase domain-containing protein [Candidatus Omnitrophota bacterium]
MEAEDKVLEHFESVSSDFEAVYEGGQDFWLYKLIDITFRNAILEKRRKLTIDLCGNVEGKNILDIGCGPGRYVVDLAQKKPESVLGVDMSASMIEIAQRKADALGLSKLCEFEMADFMKKNFEKRFDIVIACGIFDYIYEPKAFLSKIRNVLNGRAIISFPVKWTLMTPLRMIWLAKRKCPNFYYTRSMINKLLYSCGFRIEKVYKMGSFIVPGNYLVACKVEK